MNAAARAPLFASIPEGDPLNLRPGGKPDYDKITDLLGYRRNDVAAAIGLPAKKVRHDDKMPAELRQRLVEWATILNLVAEYFHDVDKVALWIHTPNPLLGDLSPRDMIRLGRYSKLLKFVQSSLQENQR